MQQPQPNNKFIPQPSFNTNYMQQPMPNPQDITDPTTTMNMALVLMVKAFKLNYTTPTNNNQRFHQTLSIGGSHSRNVKNPVVQNVVQNLGVQNVGNHNGLIVVPGIANPNANRNRNGNVVAARAKGIQIQAEEFDLMAVVGDLDDIKKVNANCILMANL
ncbi:hypothetical protein Tco_1471618 [Tanacetum coccineum]